MHNRHPSHAYFNLGAPCVQNTSTGWKERTPAWTSTPPGSVPLLPHQPCDCIRLFMWMCFLNDRHRDSNKIQLGEALHQGHNQKQHWQHSWWQQLNFEGLFCFWHWTHGTSDLMQPRVTQGGRDHVDTVLEIRNRHPPSSCSRGGRLSACEPYPPPHTALASGPTAPVHPGHPSVWPPAPWHQHTTHCIRIPPCGITMWSQNLIEEKVQPGKNTH